MSQFDKTMFDRLNTLVIQHEYYEYAYCRSIQAVETSTRYDDRTLLPLIGPSGSGKSTVIKLVHNHFQELAADAGQPCRIKYMALPRNKSTKAVLMKMQYVLGHPMYFQGSEAEMQLRIVELCRRQSIKTFLLDELQHSVSPNGSVNFDLADLFKTLLDEASVNIVAAGLEDSFSLLFSNEQLERRSLQHISLPRFNWEDEKQRDVFIGVIEGFREGLDKIRMPDFNNVDAAFRWFVGTGGLIGQVHKVFRAVLDLAEAKNRVRITWDDIDEAHQTAVLYRGPQVRPFSKSFKVDDVSAGIEHASRIARRNETEASTPGKKRPSMRGATAAARARAAKKDF